MSKTAKPRSDYLEIDVAMGENHLRIFLPHVDFANLQLAKPSMFQETLLDLGFSPDVYAASIWILSTTPY